MYIESPSTIILSTERLTLRPFQNDDLSLIQQIYCNEKILKYMPYDVMGKQEAVQYLEKIIKNWGRPPEYNHEMAVLLKSTGERIGRAHISVDVVADTGMIGWIILPEHQGRGYATETTFALIDCCFDIFHLHRVNALCNPENKASWQVMEYCGMRREAWHREKCRYEKGGLTWWVDELQYAILFSERKKGIIDQNRKTI